MTDAILRRAGDGARLDDGDALALAGADDLARLTATAATIRDAARPRVVSYSRKVFVPLTRLCRDVCHYCTFARPPRPGEAAYLSPQEVLAIARAGAAAGCTEALFTLGDRPETRYRAARDALADLGHTSTLAYLAEVADLVFRETGLFPHLNPGLMTAGEIAALRPVSASMGLMLESTAERLCGRGGPHFGSPDKRPAARLETLRLAGAAGVATTSGILIGIGETRRERIEALLALRAIHDEHGHLQEVIVQNFLAKPGTRMAAAAEPDFDDHLWSVAVARIVLGGDVVVQAPPNLARGALPRLIGAGIDDWGGVSPVTPDHVNPEAPWPHLDVLRRATEAAGKVLVQRLPIHPSHLREAGRWLAPAIRTAALRRIDGDGFVREDGWSPGTTAAVPPPPRATARPDRAGLGRLLDDALAGRGLDEAAIVRLLAARGPELAAVTEAADALRRATVGDAVSYVVTRNINYTNVCTYGCRFCAFSKGTAGAGDAAYDLRLDEIERRVAEAWARGATEVCLQGGIHPRYTGDTYLAICRAAKRAAPGIHIHAFSPLEIRQGAATLGLPVGEYLLRLHEAGLGTLPGTAAEILDDAVRRDLCPDKLSTQEWLDVMRTAHGLGIRSTATIMFGHIEAPVHVARHLLRLRRLQAETGGFTEFVPLPFVHMEAPIWRRGLARCGPTFRETLLLHAVARLALHPLVANIQASWVKLGGDGVAAVLAAGVNDLGGTLMNESISRAAGAAHGEEMSPPRMEALIAAAGRRPRQRTTLYADAGPERRDASFAAAALAAPVNTPAGHRARREGGRGAAVLAS